MQDTFLTWYDTLNKTIQPPRAKGGCRVYFRHQGEPIMLSIRDASGKPVRDPDEAPKYIRKVVEGWWQRRLSEPRSSLKTGILLKYRVRAFLKENYDPRYYSQGTIDGVESNLQEMVAVLPDYELKAVTRKVFREVVVPAIEPKVLPKTWANKLADLKRFFKWETEQEDDEGNPHLEVDPTVGTKRPPSSSFGTREQIWEEEWFPMVRERLPDPLKEIMDDFWFTGMDTKDLWEFEPLKHMRQDAKGFWKIYKKRAKESEIIDQPLNSKIRDRWIARRAQCKPGDKLHPNSYQSEKTWGNWIRLQVQEVLSDLGLPKVDLKSTRHTFATRHVKRLVRGEKNAPTLDEIRRWLGHAKDSRVLEKIYARLQSSAELMD